MESEDETFYVMFSATDVRTMTLDQVADAFRLDLIEGSTLICRVGDNQWESLSEAAGLGDDEEEEEHLEEIEDELVSVVSQSFQPFDAHIAAGRGPAAPTPHAPQQTLPMGSPMGAPPGFSGPAPGSPFSSSSFPPASAPAPSAFGGSSSYPPRSAAASPSAAPSAPPQAGMPQAALQPAPAQHMGSSFPPATASNPSPPSNGSGSTNFTAFSHDDEARDQPAPAAMPIAMGDLQLDDASALVSFKKKTPGSKLKWTGVALAGLVGLGVILQRNGVLHSVAESSGKGESYLALENTVLGAPAESTPRGVMALWERLLPGGLVSLDDLKRQAVTDGIEARPINDSAGDDEANVKQAADLRTAVRSNLAGAKAPGPTPRAATSKQGSSPPGGGSKSKTKGDDFDPLSGL